MRSATHRVLGVSPGALTFSRDMLLPIPILTDYNLIRIRKQAVIDESNRKENLRRRYKDYQVGDQVMIKADGESKLDPKTTGPFVVEQVHANGTITIERKPNVYERINIRRVVPYTTG